MAYKVRRMKKRMSMTPAAKAQRKRYASNAKYRAYQKAYHAGKHRAKRKHKRR